MLQISTGKFYGDKPVHEKIGYGILYSNYEWSSSIETCVGTLEPVDHSGNVKSYIFKFTNRLPQGGNLVSTGDHEIIEQFKLLFSFYFKCIADHEKDLILKHCRENKLNMNDPHTPFEIAGRNFKNEIRGKEEEVAGFKVFLKRIVFLERKKYNKLLQCLKAYNNSLLVLNDNFELAYSLLIYCLESMSQSFDNYEPTWADYNNQTKLALEKEFVKLDKESADSIKSILLEESHLKLQQRFIRFIKSHISNEFYTSEAKEITQPIRVSNLDVILKNAYSLRSKYVHSLEGIIDELKNKRMAQGEFLYLKGSPYLTYRGLLRLTHYIILSFFTSQEVFEKEDYPWEQELPNSYDIKIYNPKILNDTQNFDPSKVLDIFMTFLNDLETTIYDAEPLTHSNELMEMYIEKIPQAKKSEKLIMKAHILMYNLHLEENYKIESFDIVKESYSDELFNSYTIEALLTFSLSLAEIPYRGHDAIDIFKNYINSKYKPRRLQIPQKLELIIILEIANTFLKEEDVKKFMCLLDYAIKDAPSKSKFQEYLNDCIETQKLVKINEATKYL